MENLEEMSEKELLGLCQNGNRDKALSEFYRRYFNHILGYSMTLSKNRCASEDLTQDAFTELIQKIDNKKLKYQNPGGIKSYLRSIVHNKFVNNYRKNERFNNFILSSPFDFEKSPEEKIISEERKSILREDVKNLSPPLKDVLKSQYFDEFSYKEISERLGIKMGTVKSRIYFGKEKLRKKYTSRD